MKTLKNLKKFEDYSGNQQTFLDTYTTDDLKEYGWTKKDFNIMKNRVLQLNPLWNKVSRRDRIKFLMDVGAMSKGEAMENDTTDLGGLPLEILDDYLLDEVQQRFSKNL